MKHLLFSILLVTAFLPLVAQQRTLPEARLEALEKEYKVLLFRGADGSTFDMESDPAAQSALAYRNVLEWLQGRVAGLQVYRQRGIPIAYMRGYPAALYLDELRVDPVAFDLLPLSDIGYIKVIKGPVVIAGAAGGVIAVYTKRGEDGQ